MRIITDNAVYLQKSDIVFLMRNDALSLSMSKKVFGNDLVAINASNRYEFVKFTMSEEIEFFQSLDCIIDYNQVKDLAEEEINALTQSIMEERNDTAQRLNSMSIEERGMNMDMVFQLKSLDFKANSLRDLLCFKQGRIKMKFPEGVDHPTGNRLKKGIIKLIKTVFKNGEIN